MNEPAIDQRDYIARCPVCNRLVAAVIEECPDRNTYVTQWLRAGLSIDRLATVDTRKADWGHAKDCLFDK